MNWNWNPIIIAYIMYLQSHIRLKKNRFDGNMKIELVKRISRRRLVHVET